MASQVVDQMRIEQAVSGELVSGEERLWAGCPDSSQMVRRTSASIVPGLVCMLVLVYRFGPAIANGEVVQQLRSGDYLLTIVCLLILLIFVGSLHSLLSAPRRARWTVYAITNRRLIIMNYGIRLSVGSFGEADLGRCTVTERGDGTGDLEFADSVLMQNILRSTGTRAAFRCIPDVRAVEKLVRATFRIHT